MACLRVAPYDVPCPQVPRFPKFEEVKLEFKQDDNGWSCYAPTIKGVYLMPTRGASKAKAAELMHQRYLERVKPWKD